MLGDGDDNFIRQNAAAIAAALREQDDVDHDGTGATSGSSTTSKIRSKKGNSPDTSAYDLYRELCFDDPLVENVDACLTLSRKLKEQNSKNDNKKSSSKDDHYLALSNRFVNGLVQCCQRTEGSEPFATLAYTVFVEIPLCCCQSEEDLETIQRYLGSYKGIELVPPSPDEQQNNSLVDEKENLSSTEPVVEHISDPVEPDTSTVDSDIDIKTSTSPAMVPSSTRVLDEVWATESDPSDYDFGEGTTELEQKVSSLELQDWMDELIIDPWKLSQPDPTLTFHQAKVALKSLLQHAKYNVLAPLFDKNRSAIAQQLTQLVLMLFTATSASDDVPTDATSPTKLLDENMKSCGFEALWILRDAALQRKSCVGSYLEVLQTLLAVDDALEQDQGQKGAPQLQSNGQIASATVVGITSLASWCSQDFDSTVLKETQECIIGAVNDLSHVMEKSLLPTENNKSDPASSNVEANRNHLRNNMLPILEILAGIDWMGQKRGNTTNMCTRPQVPQALLNSGFFRNLLVLGLEEKIPQNLKYQCHHSLLFLCVASPTVLGKYAWRYPGIAAMIQIEPTTSTGMVHSILWNALGSALCSSGGGTLTSLTSLRKPGTKTTTAPKQQTPPLSVEFCKTTCQENWKLFCIQCVDVLQSLESPPDPIHAQTLQDFERLANSLVSCPFLCDLFVPLADSKCLGDLRSVVATLPVVSTEKPGDGDADEEGEKPKRSGQIEIVARTRKALKTMALVFEGSTKASSKTD